MIASAFGSYLAPAVVLASMLLASCTRSAGSASDEGVAAFLSEGRAGSSEQAQPAHAGIVEFRPLVAEVALPAGERRGSTAFVIHNPGTRPLAIAHLRSHCRSCRITADIPRRIDPGAEIEIPVAVAIGRLESLPSRRFLVIALLTPDDQLIEQVLTVAISRAPEDDNAAAAE